jgi:hypothetical protein
MVTRTSSRQVTFRRPFLLSGFEAMQAAGTYTVDTEEELIDALSFSAWKRVATVMQLARGGAMEYLPVDPDDLSGALMRDGAPLDASSPPVIAAQSRHEGARTAINELRTRGGRH